MAIFRNPKNLLIKLRNNHNMDICKCPPDMKNCNPKKINCDPIVLQSRYTLSAACSIVLEAFIGGLAFGIAIIMQYPIALFVGSMGITDELLVYFVTALIYFGIAIIAVWILFKLNKHLSKISMIAKENKIELQ